jgi:hypothetical protein
MKCDPRKAALRTPEPADPGFSEIFAGATKQCRRPEPGRLSQSKKRNDFEESGTDSCYLA